MSPDSERVLATASHCLICLKQNVLSLHFDCDSVTQPLSHLEHHPTFLQFQVQRANVNARPAIEVTCNLYGILTCNLERKFECTYASYHL